MAVPVKKNGGKLVTEIRNWPELTYMHVFKGGIAFGGGVWVVLAVIIPVILCALACVFYVFAGTLTGVLAGAG